MNKEVKIFNSLTNKVETVKSIKPNEISMYVCGSTVYDSPHIGNLRPIVAFDVLRRLFMYLGYKVTYVSNFTDVDDKIIAKALKEGVSEMDIANRYIKEIKELIKDIGSLEASSNPRVSEYMDKIIDYIDGLVKSGHAYELDGDVYFRVSSIPNYGELSKIDVEELKVGARIEEKAGKESPLDFALWKKTDVGIKWSSPWGLGRPGWHTECCVMIDSIFPNGLIDIHGGGFDLKFPHHENEMAQNKASHHNKLANYWVHNGFVTFNEDKMSKSLGNVISAKDAIKEYGGDVVRLSLLLSHYRAPAKFNDETINNAKAILNRIKDTYNKVAIKLQMNNVDLNTIKENNIEPFVNALSDDLNVSNALTYLFDVLKSANNELRKNPIDIKSLSIIYKSIQDMLYLLGLNILPHILNNDDKQLLLDYDEARKNKDYEKSDIIRQELIKHNLI